MLSAYVAAIFATVCGQVVKWDHKKPIIVTFGDRDGHNYLFRYDYVSSSRTFVHTGVAVLVNLNEITFSGWPVKNYYDKLSCVSFQTLRGTETSCKEYFMLADDWYKFERRTWDKGFEANDCKKVQFYNSVLVFIKYDVQKDSSPKFVGTYYTTRDRLLYEDANGNRVVITNFKKRMEMKFMSPTKYEVVCTRERA